MDIFIESNDIKQYHISESLIKSEAFNLYKKQLNIYSCKKTSTIFFGVYTMADITHIKNHTGTKFIYWAGNDANISNINRIKVINLLKKFNINQHLCCNKLIQSNLKLLNVDSLIMNINESKYIKKYFDINQINQIHISSALIHLKDQIFNKFNFRSYDNLNEDCIFFGLYNTKDIDLLNKHNGKKYLMWGGNDALFESKAFYLNYLEKRNLFHISISNDLFDRLTKFNLDPLIFRLNLVNTEIFKPVNERGHKIFIYNGINKGQEETYGKSIYDEIVKRLPEYEYIYSNELNVPNEKMPEIYAQCFIGLRLTKNDGNANMVQEMEAMNIPVVHNLSDYGLKWDCVDDIINIILTSSFDDDKITNNNLNIIYKNIDYFTNLISEFNNILFICGDYPGYGGAATNCNELQNFYSDTHNTFAVYYNFNSSTNKKYESNENYCIIDLSDLENKIVDFNPDLIILKSFVKIDLKQICNCPVYYCVGGIYPNNLDKYYHELKTLEDHNKYINVAVLDQIKISDKVFCNSKLTQKILKDIYNLDTYVFYSGFVPYYNKKIEDDPDFENRKYEYGLIVSNFERKIKNVDMSINFLKDKQNVLLIGENCSKYKKNGFECIENVNHTEISNYYKQIKYIQQNSFFESYSNSKIESTFNGCKTKLNIVVSSTQYPGYGGAATNAYQIIKFLRQNGYNTTGVFFDTTLDIDYDPENIGGVFLYNFKKYDENKIRNDVKSYLKVEPNYCLAKNYRAPYICKEIFKCYTVYLVSGINHFSHYVGKSSEDILNKDFSIDFKIPEEIKCNTLCDKIVINSKLSYDIFNKIYPTFQNKIYPSIVDTTSCINIQSNFINNSKEFDIVIACSRLDRVDKNNLFLIDIFLRNPKFDKYTKMIIGSNFDKFIDIPNTQCVGLCEQTKCIEYMSKSKVLLFPSLFDANSNTIREAIYYKCLPLITKNIGFYEVFPDFLICKSYTNKEWSSKLLYILENYSNIKDTQFNFNTGKNIIDFLEKN